MAIYGITLDRENPQFTFEDFTFWQPQFRAAMTPRQFDKLYGIANEKIYKSILGVDWEYGMSLCIAHYLELIAINERVPISNDLRTVAGGTSYRGIISSMSIGNFSKSIDTGASLINSEDAFFWNQTSYGANLMALMKTKSIPSIFVVTGDGSRGGK